MSTLTVRAALVARYAGIAVNANLDYWPTSAAPPMLFTVRSRGTLPVQAGLRVDVQYFDTWLIVAWQNNGTAEDDIEALLTAVPVAIQADQTLGALGVIAAVEDYTVTFLQIGTTYYRAVRYTVRVKETNG